jgi:hypothetical protein
MQLTNAINIYMASFTNSLNQGSNFLTGAAGSIGTRLSKAGLPLGGIFGSTKSQSNLQSGAGAPSATGDWAVKISVTDAVYGDLMGGAPLFPASFQKYKGIRFPVTPFINMSHTAAYDARSVIHNNYPYYAYQNSQVDQMTIAGSFPVQTQADGLNWMASLHFLRTVTKMYYGGVNNQGNPPPVCRLNGYGDYIYKDVPIVVTNFTVELREQVDYLGINVPTGGGDNNKPAGHTSRSMGVTSVKNAPGGNGGVGGGAPGSGMSPGERNAMTGSTTQAEESSGSINYVPTDSLISITVVPVYSRNKISKTFNLKDFASGKLTKEEGFI